jgi:CRISPR-associated protein Cmx8
MARTAENVGFFDRARRQFLLHFWPYVAQVYVPQTVNVMDATSEFHGFAIAIPDVGELDDFCGDFVYVLNQRTKDLDRYRPRGAVIELAEEAALDLASQLRGAVAAREGRNATRDLVIGYDVIHVNKEGNNVRVYANTRITPDARLLAEYERVRRAQYYDPLFRRQVLRNVIDGRRWYDGFDRMFETTPYKKQTIGRWQFCRDCTMKFRERNEEMTTRNEEPVGEKNLDVLVREMITAYVMRKADAKSKTTWDRAKGNPKQKHDWEEQKERAARDAFLAVRSRAGSDFVDYFVGTLCSQGQFLPPKRFETIAKALKENLDEVRTLTMLALSAQAWISTNDKKTEE